MAGRNIKGITIEIGGDTAGLQKALSDVNGKIKNTQAQLKDVERLLKLDPTNTVLVAQKQELLKQAVSETAEKLQKLETAQEQVNDALKKGEIGQEQYMAFQREVEETKATLSRYQSELDGVSDEQNRLAQNTQRLNKLFEAIDGSVDEYADVLGTKLVSAIKNGSASADQLKLAIEKIGRVCTGGKGDIKQITDALDTLDDGQAIKNLITDLKMAGNQANQTGEQLDSMGKTLTGGMLVEAAEQLQSVGEKITELGNSAKDAFLESQDASVKASTYFAETGEAAEQTAAVIKDVYTQGVGESMDAVSNAVVTVKKNIQDLDQVTLTNLTQQAITLDELYGIDMNETLRGVNALMVNFGMDAQTAMDYIVKGTQNSLDKTNELGDNLSEYSGKFAQAGYSAQEYFQLLQNGLEGGAYNLDKVNDAINEVTTRLVDGTIADAIVMYSGKTQELFESWKNGGATQKEVINSIVEDINGCTNQQEALNMAATAFGTMAEDGSAKFITSLTTMGTAYDDVAGSAQNMFDQSTTESQKFEASMRKLKEALIPLGEILVNLANTILPPLAKGIQAIGDFFGKLPEPVQHFVVILGGLIAAFAALAPMIAAVAFAVTTLQISLLPIIAGIGIAALAITGIIALVKNWGAVTEWFGNLWTTVKEKCVKAWQGICSFFTETIPQAWDGLVGKFQGVQAWWSGIWQQVGDFFSNIWNSICSFFTETIPQAWQSVVSWFQGIPAWWSGIWQQVADFFTNIWSAMMQNPVLAGIVNTITALWQNATVTLQNIWTNIQTIAGAAWEFIKNVILGPVLLLIDLVTGDFEKLKSDAQNIWENIKNAAVQIWTSLKDLVSNIVQGLITHTVTIITGFQNTLKNIWTSVKETASNLWTSLKDFVIQTATNLKNSVSQAITNLKDSVSQAWQNMKNAASQAWQNIKEFVVQTANNLKESAVNAFQNLVSGIRGKLSSLGNTVRNGFRDAISFITSLPRQALTWGADMVNGIARGIRNAIGNVTSAVKSVANKIRSFLHFSVPDEGPLTDYESWMPDFMQGLAKGIEKSKSMVTKAIAGVSEDMTISANAMVEQSGLKQTDALTAMMHTMAQCLHYLKAGHVLTWDSGEVAAKLAPEMNVALGELAVEEGYM